MRSILANSRRRAAVASTTAIMEESIRGNEKREREEGATGCCILVSIDTFDPISYAHLRMFERARDYVEKRLQLRVLCGIASLLAADRCCLQHGEDGRGVEGGGDGRDATNYTSPLIPHHISSGDVIVTATDSGMNSFHHHHQPHRPWPKEKKNEEKIHIPIHHRRRMLELALRDSDWIRLICTGGGAKTAAATQEDGVIDDHHDISLPTHHHRRQCSWPAGGGGGEVDWLGSNNCPQLLPPTPSSFSSPFSHPTPHYPNSSSSSHAGCSKLNLKNGDIKSTPSWPPTSISSTSFFSATTTTTTSTPTNYYSRWRRKSGGGGTLPFPVASLVVDKATTASSTTHTTTTTFTSSTPTAAATAAASSSSTNIVENPPNNPSQSPYHIEKEEEKKDKQSVESVWWELGKTCGCGGIEDTYSQHHRHPHQQRHSEGGGGDFYSRKSVIAVETPTFNHTTTLDDKVHSFPSSSRHCCNNNGNTTPLQQQQQQLKWSEENNQKEEEECRGKTIRSSFGPLLQALRLIRTAASTRHHQQQCRQQHQPQENNHNKNIRQKGRKRVGFSHVEEATTEEEHRLEEEVRELLKLHSYESPSKKAKRNQQQSTRGSCANSFTSQPENKATATSTSAVLNQWYQGTNSECNYSNAYSPPLPRIFLLTPTAYLERLLLPQHHSHSREPRVQQPGSNHAPQRHSSKDLDAHDFCGCHCGCTSCQQHHHQQFRAGIDENNNGDACPGGFVSKEELESILQDFELLLFHTTNSTTPPAISLLSSAVGKGSKFLFKTAEELIDSEELLTRYRDRVHVVVDNTEREENSFYSADLLPEPNQIRKALLRGDSVKYCVPDSVLAYIEEHHLYRKLPAAVAASTTTTTAAEEVTELEKIPHIDSDPTVPPTTTPPPAMKRLKKLSYDWNIHFHLHNRPPSQSSQYDGADEEEGRTQSRCTCTTYRPPSSATDATIRPSSLQIQTPPIMGRSRGGSGGAGKDHWHLPIWVKARRKEGKRGEEDWLDCDCPEAAAWNDCGDSDFYRPSSRYGSHSQLTRGGVGRGGNDGMMTRSVTMELCSNPIRSSYTASTTTPFPFTGRPPIATTPNTTSTTGEFIVNTNNYSSSDSIWCRKENPTSYPGSHNDIRILSSPSTSFYLAAHGRAGHPWSGTITPSPKTSGAGGGSGWTEIWGKSFPNKKKNSSHLHHQHDSTHPAAGYPRRRVVPQQEYGSPSYETLTLDELLEASHQWIDFFKRRGRSDTVLQMGRGSATATTTFAGQQGEEELYSNGGVGGSLTALPTARAGEEGSRVALPASSPHHQQRAASVLEQQKQQSARRKSAVPLTFRRYRLATHPETTV